ncbi:MAG: hypothetical protein HUJ94_04150 [Bacteroidales bacterium]|nr:hypothetical protein [Bacteroidales bacterium]
MYSKIVKIISWVLLLASAALAVWGFAIGWPDSAVDVIIYWTYAMLAIGLISIFIIGIGVSASINPKSLIKILGVIFGIAVVVGIAYLLAPGTPAVGYLGEPVTDGTLKFTDTILNLTYLTFGCSLLSIVVGVIIKAVRK